MSKWDNIRKHDEEKSQQMAEPLFTQITIAESYGRGLGNLTMEECRFYGRPNFAGEMNQFKDARRQFTVQIPPDAADHLRGLGWNVRTKRYDPTPDNPEPEIIEHLKVMVDIRFDREHPDNVAREKGPDIWIIQGEDREKLNSLTVPLLDRARFERIDMELRAWEYNPEEDPGKYSARLVMLVAVMRPSILESKYGRLR